MNTITYDDLGTIAYKEAWDYQESLVKAIQDTKLQNRGREHPLPTSNHLLFCRHPHVYTLGKSGSADHLLWNADQLQQKQVEFVHTNRGGDITYHGPGQIVGYPILDLDNFFTDLHKYLRSLEAVIIDTLGDFGITAGRYPGFTGVWIDPDHPRHARKICAMGVKCTRWITMHGFALNVDPDLSYFTGIVPCGIGDKAVTSMRNELGYVPEESDVKEKLTSHFGTVFNSKIIPSTTEQKTNQQE